MAGCRCLERLLASIMQASTFALSSARSCRRTLERLLCEQPTNRRCCGPLFRASLGVFLGVGFSVFTMRSSPSDRPLGVSIRIFCPLRWPSLSPTRERYRSRRCRTSLPPEDASWRWRNADEVAPQRGVEAFTLALEHVTVTAVDRQRRSRISASSARESSCCAR
jgi:hypothetical protein